MSLGWLSIGATNDITLTGLNVDNGTLYVDKVNNRVGIGSTVLSNILQVGSPSVGISTYNPLSSSGIAMFSNKYASPNTAGVSDFGATLWINSSFGYLQNAGASIGLGAVSSSSVDSTHTTYARISGVQTMDTDDRKGDFVIETTNNDKLYERVRVKAEGNVGIGLDNPAAKLHVNGNFISETGITNNGYRREKPVSFEFPNSSSERVTNNNTLTMLAPAGTGRGWLARIDDGSELNPQSEYINGVISSASDGVIFAVGTFTGHVSVYQEGGLVVESTFQTNERSYPQAQAGFVARYTDEGLIEEFAVIEYPSTVELTSVTLSGISEPDVIVTGYLTKIDSANIVIYNSGSPDPGVVGSVSQQPVPGVSNGGKVGFVIVYSFNLIFKRIVFIHTTEGFSGEVMPTNCACYNSSTENILYVSGQFKASDTSFVTNATSGDGSLATISTAGNHGFVAGDKVLVYGVEPTSYNGYHTITGATLDTFTFASSATGSQTVAGNVTKAVIIAETTNYPGVIDQGVITVTPIRTTSYDVFLCRYDINTVGPDTYLAPVWMNSIQNSIGATDENVDHPSRALSIDDNNGDVYMCGYSRSNSISFYNNDDIEQTSFTLSKGSSTQVGFMARYDKTGAIKWSGKITGSVSGEEATIRSLTFHSESKRLIVTGSFKGNSVSFFNSGNSSTPVVSQEGIEDKFSAFVASYDCSPASSCNVIWTTKFQPKQQNVYGMIIDNDVNGNIYTSFHLVTASTTYSNVRTDVYTAYGLQPTFSTYHNVTGIADYIGIVCLNPNGKVLFTSKIDGSGTENIRAMDVYGPNADDPSRLIVGMVSGGNNFNCFDMTGISFKFATNLFNTPVTNTTSAFVIQFPSFTFYLMDTPPVELGTVKKFVNTTKNRAYVIPYYDPDEDVNTAYTNAIYAVPGGSSIELTHGAPESWYASKDTDSSSIYVDKINGGVGIGTTEPQRLLHVDGEALIRGNIYIDGLIINPYITFGLSGAIGIGTTNPLSFLHIYKPNPKIILQNSVGNSEQTSGTLDLIERNASGARLTFDGRSGVDSFFIKMLDAGTEQSPPALTISNRIDVTPGFVGIGITTPAKHLHVKDSFRIEAKSRFEENNSIEEQQVRSWYPLSNYVQSSGIVYSCAYAPNIGINGLGRWVIVSTGSSSEYSIAYNDDGGDSVWTTGIRKLGSDILPVTSIDKLKSVNPGVNHPSTDFEGTRTDSTNYRWSKVIWIEAAPVAPPESELPTLTENTTLPSSYSGIVKVKGKYSPAETVITLPTLDSDYVGRTITIMKMDTDEDTIVRVTTEPGTNISASASVWLGRNTAANSTTVKLGCVGAANQSSRNNLRVVWTADGYWNVDGPNDHPDFPDGVFVTVNNNSASGSPADGRRALAYSFRHERQNWASTSSRGSTNQYESTIIYKYSNAGIRTDFTGNALPQPPNSSSVKPLVFGPESGDTAVNYLTPRDIKCSGTDFYVCGLYRSNSAVSLHTSVALGATGTSYTGTSYRAFVMKISTTGAVVWARSIDSIGSIDGSIGSSATSLAVDSAGNVYVTGEYYHHSGSLTLDSGVTLPPTGFNSRLFIVKLNSSGAFTAAYGHPTANGSAGRGILTRSTNDVFYSGILNSNTIFIGRIDQNLSYGSVDESMTITSPTLSGIGFIGPAIAMNTSGNRIYLTGRYKSDTNISVGSAYTLPAKLSGICQGFLISFQINSSFDGFTSIWGRTIISSSADYSEITNVVVDGAGNVFVTGSYETSVPVELTTGGAVLPITYKYGVSELTPQSSFIASYTSQGESRWANTIQNTVLGLGNSITRDSSNNIYVSGTYRSDPGKKLLIGKNQSGDNAYLYPNSAEISTYDSAFLIKYTSDGIVEWARNHGLSNNNSLNRSLVAIDSSNFLYWAYDLLGRGRSYEATISEVEAGERWFIVSTTYGYFYQAIAYDSLANRLMLFVRAGTGSGSVVFTKNTGRDNPSAGNFWAQGTTYWGVQNGVVSDYVTGVYYKQGSRAGTGYGVAGGNCNSYTMVTRDARAVSIGRHYWIRSDLHSTNSLSANNFGYSFGDSLRTLIGSFDLTYSPQLNRFICCGTDGLIPSSTSKANILIINPINVENIQSSSDFHVNMNSVRLSDYYWQGVTWAAELGYFVAIAGGNYISTIAYSTDGSTWKFLANPDTGSDRVVNLISIGWGSKTGFLAVGSFTDNGRNLCMIRTRRFEDPGTTLVDTIVESNPDGTTSANLVFGKAPFYTPLGNAPLFMVRAWATFNGKTSNGLYSFGNIKTFTRVSTGIYEFTFIVPMHTDTYTIMMTGTGGGGIADVGGYSAGLKPSVTKFRVVSTSNAGSLTDYEYLCVMVIC